MEKLQNLLSRVSAIVQLDKQHQAERRKRGEMFNVFDVLGLSTNETRTHSAFIAELLNPKGDHGLGDRFLQAFIQSVRCLQGLDFDTAKAQVKIELPIGCKNEDCTEGGRIDILIESNGKAIIIENKIYASDQENQLIRYANYGKPKYAAGFRLLYLTLSGVEASEASCSTMKPDDEYFPIGYKAEILSWLERCIQLSAMRPLVRETIIQYQNLIKKLTNQDMETQFSEKIIEIMSKPENIETVVEMQNLYAQWERHIIEKYLKEPLKAFAESKDMKFEFDEEMFSKKTQCGFYFYKDEWQSAIIYFFTEKLDWKNFYRGVASRSVNRLAVEQTKLQCLSNKPNDCWPYGWEYLKQYKDWDSNTMSDMANGKFVEYIKESVEEMLAEIESRKLQMP